MTNLDVTNIMNGLKEIFAPGLYWNHDPSQPNDPESVRDVACSHHSTVNCDDYTQTGACGCNSYGGGSQCFGFALYMAKKVFGVAPVIMVANPGNGYDFGGGWRAYSGTYKSGLTLEPGDVVRTQTHSAIIHTVSGENVQVAEVLGSYNCRIAWGGFNDNSETVSTASEILAAAEYVIKAPKGDPITVTLNANGGTCSTATKSVYYGSTYGDLPVPTRSGFAFAGWWSDELERLATTTVTATEAHTLWARWTKVYTVTNLGASKCLNIYGDNLTSLSDGINVTLWSASGSNEQKWLMALEYDDRPIKSAIDQAYGLNVYLDSTYNCNIHQVAGNEADAIVHYINYGSFYRIGLYNYNLYLTAAGTGDGANVYWATYAESDLQKWVLTEV